MYHPRVPLPHLSQLVFLLVLAGSVSVFAKPPTCFSSFATLGEGEDPVPLIEQTYAQLIDRLGSGLKSEQIKAMVEAGDPFTVGDAPESEALQKSLTEFRALLEQRAWNSGPTQRRLLETLSAWQAARQDADIRVRIKVQRGKEPTDVPFESGAKTTMSPDGRFIAAIPDFPRGETTSIYWHDSLMGKTTKVDVPGVKAVSLAFDPDGSALHLTWMGKIVRVPIQQDALAVAQKQSFGEDWLGYSPPTLIPGGKPGVSYFSSAHPQRRLPRFRRIDTQSGTVTDIDLKTLLDESLWSLNQWGVVPGTSTVWFLWERGGSCDLALGEFSADGKWTPSTIPQRHFPYEKFDPPRVAVGAKQAYLTYGSEVKIVDLETLAEKTVELPPEKWGNAARVHDLAASAHSDRLAVRVNSSAAALLHVDTQTGQVLSTVPLTNGDQIKNLRLNPSGDVATVDTPDGIRVIPLQN